MLIIFGWVLIMGLYITIKKNKILYHFNKDSSPILSDSVLSIKSNQIGMMYVLTNLGLQTINTSVTRPEINTDNIKFYPNPLKLQEHDRLYFAGLPSSTKVRITSIGGDLIFETKNRWRRVFLEPSNGNRK